MSISLNIVLIPYHIQCGVEIYKLGFFIKRAKSQWCVGGKYTTVAFCTELTACRSRRAEARLSFKRALVSYPKTRQRELARNSRPVKWLCSTPAAWPLPLRHLSCSLSRACLPLPLPALSGGQFPPDPAVLGELHRGPLHTTKPLVDFASFLTDSVDVEELLFIPSLRLCVLFYLNVFAKLMFCLPGFLQPESKYIREKK